MEIDGTPLVAAIVLAAGYALRVGAGGYDRWLLKRTSAACSGAVIRWSRVPMTGMGRDATDICQS